MVFDIIMFSLQFSHVGDDFGAFLRYPAIPWNDIDDGSDSDAPHFLFFVLFCPF